MNDSTGVPLKIGLKYCGGCRPEYDRPGLVSYIQKQLGPAVSFLPADHPDIAMVLAVEGCQTACADLTPDGRLPVWIITGPDQADPFIEHIRSLQKNDASAGSGIPKPEQCAKISP